MEMGGYAAVLRDARLRAWAVIPPKIPASPDPCASAHARQLVELEGGLADLQSPARPVGATELRISQRRTGSMPALRLRQTMAATLCRQPHDLS